MDLKNKTDKELIMLCKECEKKGLTSTITITSNTTITEYSCSRGHKWIEKKAEERRDDG